MSEAAKSPFSRKLYFLWLGLAFFSALLMAWTLATWQRWIPGDPPYRPLSSLTLGVSQLGLALSGVAAYRNWAKMTYLMMALAFAGIVANIAVANTGR